MNTPHTHRLFQQYPLTEKATLSVGTVPVPYHIYNGYGVFIAGTADLSKIRSLLASGQVTPMANEEGRALIGLWICNFQDASLGPHHELQFSIFVQRQPVPPVSKHPLGLLAAMLKRHDMQMMCHGVYNNTPEVVAYNRELLSLNARLTNSLIERPSRSVTFSFTDAASNGLIVEGTLKWVDRVSMRANFDFIRQLGFMDTLKVVRLPWITMEIVNPLGVGLTQNCVAQAFTKNDVNIIQYFNPQDHSLRFGKTPYGDLDFRPQVLQFMDGFKFVYLNPA